ncbi:MAG TPA: hypothetical protein VF884_07065 [Nitrososphaeraceae archaeon]
MVKLRKLSIIRARQSLSMSDPGKAKIEKHLAEKINRVGNIQLPRSTNH